MEGKKEIPALTIRIPTVYPPRPKKIIFPKAAYPVNPAMIFNPWARMAYRKMLVSSRIQNPEAI
jgi:hypothetical protein